MGKRLQYLLAATALISISLFLRKQWAQLPHWLNIWIGDFLWAVMLYTLARALFIAHDPRKLRNGLILFCCAVELSQAIHTGWLDAFRSTYFGGLLLGHGFLWTDILAYSAGVLVAYWMDTSGMNHKWRLR
jgi:Protein of unknown function (DUF2809)